MSVYLIAYGIFRFAIEYARSDDRGALVSGISPSQFWALLMIVAGVIVYFALEYLAKKKRREETTEAEAEESLQ